MIKSVKRLFILAAVFSISVFSGFSQPQQGEDELLEELLSQESASESVNPELQQNFVILEPLRNHDLNPHTTSYAADSQILTGLYEGLFSYNPVTLEPQYALAVDYKVSRDKKRMTFILREDAYFSDGSKITAEDVRRSWLMLLSTPDAPYASLLDIIKGAEAFRSGTGKVDDVGIYVTDEKTLSVYLLSPANYLPKVLCHSAFSVVSSNPTAFSGPFEIFDQEEGCIVLQKNPYYWDKKNTYLDKITFIQSDDGDENAYYYNSGAVDWVTSAVTVEKVIDKNALQFSTEFGTAYYFFKNSCKKSTGKTSVNPWDYAEFRNAILEAMPWEKIRSVSFVPATTFVYPLSGYPQIDGFDYTDLIEAKSLMKEARAKYGFSEDETIPLVLDISEYGISDDQEKALKEAFAPLGVDFKVRKFSSASYFSNVKTSDSDLFSYTWIGDFADPLAFLSLFKGDSTLNDSGWKNTEYDSLLDKAASAPESERYNYLSQAESLLLDSGMVIPIYHPVSFNLIDLTEVGGWAKNAFDIHPLKYLYKKEAKKTYDNVVKR